MTDSEGPRPGLDLQGLMQSVKGVQERMQAAQETAGRITVEGNSGGGMVVARANGRGEILRVTIDPALITAGDKDMLEDLVAAAVNQAIQLGREAAKAEMAKATGGLPLPVDLTNLL